MMKLEHIHFGKAKADFKRFDFSTVAYFRVPSPPRRVFDVSFSGKFTVAEQP